MQSRPKGVSAHVASEFCKETTVHAFLRIGDSERNTVARLVWLFILLFFTAIFLWQTQQLIAKYLRHEKHTETEMVGAEKQVFPGVTICNINPYQKSLLPEDSDIYRFVNAVDDFTETTANTSEICGNDTTSSEEDFYHAMCTNEPEEYAAEPQTGSTNSESDQNQPDGYPTEASTDSGWVPLDDTSDSSNDTWNATALKRGASVMNLLQKGIRYLGTAAASDPGLYKEALQPKDQFIVDCQYNMKTCPPNMFKQISHPWFGSCYVFNPNAKAITRRPGSLYGLSMLLDVGKNQFLPTTSAGGVRVSVHRSDEIAFPETDGFLAATDVLTYVSVSRVDTTRLEAPWGTCVPTTAQSSNTRPYYYPGEYTAEGCRMSCIQRRIVYNCKCWYFAYQKPPNATVPLCQNNTDIDCAVEEELKSAENVTDSDKCQCQPPCESTDYDVRVSQAALFVPENVMELLCTSGSCDHTYVGLQLAFESLNYYKYTEQASYEWLNLLSDFGGQFGLWLGASFCSVGELLSLVISLICTGCGCARGDIERKNDECDIEDIRRKQMTGPYVMKSNQHQNQPGMTPPNKKSLYPSVAHVY